MPSNTRTPNWCRQYAHERDMWLFRAKSRHNIVCAPNTYSKKLSCRSAHAYGFRQDMPADTRDELLDYAHVFGAIIMASTGGATNHLIGTTINGNDTTGTIVNMDAKQCVACKCVSV